MIKANVAVPRSAKKLMFAILGTNNLPNALISPFCPAPKIPSAQTSEVATPGRIPGIKSRARTQKEKLLFLTAKIASAKMMGGMSAFRRSAARKMNIEPMELTKISSLKTLAKFSKPTQME